MKSLAFFPFRIKSGKSVLDSMMVHSRPCRRERHKSKDKNQHKQGSSSHINTSFVERKQGDFSSFMTVFRMHPLCYAGAVVPPVRLKAAPRRRTPYYGMGISLESLLALCALTAAFRTAFAALFFFRST